MADEKGIPVLVCGSAVNRVTSRLLARRPVELPLAVTLAVVVPAVTATSVVNPAVSSRSDVKVEKVCVLILSRCA